MGNVKKTDKLDISRPRKPSKLRQLPSKIIREIQRIRKRGIGLFSDSPVRLRKAKLPWIVKPTKRTMLANYNASPAKVMPDDFVLYRIIGNDLVPRHVKGQSYSNVQFILEHEPVLPDCQKRWIVNRIADPGEETRIIKLLESHNQSFIRIPFEDEEYRQIEWDWTGAPSAEFYFSKSFSRLEDDARQIFELHLRRKKNIYAMNNNGARNAALVDGRKRAKWILPFDGNCFFTAEGFGALRSQIIAAPWIPYTIVPMARISNNLELTQPGFVPMASEEPQIVFRNDAGLMFDENMSYGRRPKVELLWRLVVPGNWDKYKFRSWEPGRPPPAPEAGQFQNAGFVARLDSGRPDLEAGHSSIVNRGKERSKAIAATLDGLDCRQIETSIDPSEFTYFDPEAISNLIRNQPDIADDLRARADKALLAGRYSVVDKTTLPPSGDAHDYWHPAPYWWPDPSKPDGLPYIWKDGERVAGSKLYSAESEQFDRTRLQNMFDDTLVLSMASAVFNEENYGLKAANIVRTWFLDPATRMNPNLNYAQVRRGRNNDFGKGPGIIEFKDMYFFLDAVRILMRGKLLSSSELADFRKWLVEYVNWLENSPAGLWECRKMNNHGTFYDVQIGAIAAFLGDSRLVSGVLNPVKLRISCQFDLNGSQPHELNRTLPRHYTAFGLIGWTTLARLKQSLGYDLWNDCDQEGRCMARAFEWLSRAQRDDSWPRADISEFATDRLEPLWADCRHHFPDIQGIPPKPDHISAVYFPDFAITPFWMLARR